MVHLIHVPLPFIISLLFLLLAAKVLGEIAERFRQPSMIGEVIAGIILGPSVFNIINVTSDLKAIAELGVFLLIITAGLEIRVAEIRESVRGRNILIALCGFIIPMISGFFLGKAFHFNTSMSVFLGLSIAITALPVSVRILMDIGKLNTTVGQRIISAAILNDIVTLMILGIVLDSSDVTKSLRDIIFSSFFSILRMGFFVLILYIAYRLFRLVNREVQVVSPKMDKFLHFLRGKESLFALVMLFVLFFAGFAEILGIHFVVGAFFGAILIPRNLFMEGDFEKVRQTTSQMTMGFLAPIFFAYLGVSFDILSLNNVALLTSIILIAIFSKITGGYAGGLMSGLDHRRSITIGLGLNARGMMELVIANIALEKGFISISLFSILVLMAMITTLITPIMLKDAFIKIEKAEEREVNGYLRE
jgi:Kef-type K+ transport system membrane component KefB